MRLQTDILNESIEQIGENADFLVERFYERLFSLEPRLEDLFQGVNFPEQRRKIIQTLLVLIRWGNDPTNLTRFLQNLGDRHSTYELTLRDYEAFTEAFMQSLEEILGEHWTSQYEEAWGDAIEVIVSLMQAGSQQQIRKAVREMSTVNTPSPEGLNAVDEDRSDINQNQTYEELNGSSFDEMITDLSSSASNSKEENSMLVETEGTAKENGTAQPDQGQTASAEVTRLKTMLDAIPMNVIMADTDLVITYINPASIATLKPLEHLLPKPVDQLLGEKIDIFHKKPEYQRKMLADPSNLPHQANIQLGAETLSLMVSAITDDNGKYLGPMVTWEVVTEKIKMEDEMARIQNMMENIPINVLMANRDFELIYINPASVKTLKPLEHLLPKPVAELMGQKIDIFHKAPEHQRRLLDDPNNLPHRAKIQLADETLDLLVTAIMDKNNNYIGPMVTWEVVTERVKMADDFETDVKGIVDTVTASATQLEGSAKTMASNSEETSKQSQIVAAASEEASKNVQTVASSAEELNASISEIARHVQESSRMTNMAVDEATRTNDTIRELGEASNEIGQVIKVISSIAQQTNLLALNATIEAARAGEAGKGFAVVANEVKELARETAKATEEISQKIAAIQGSTDGATSAIESISQSIGKIDEITTTIASAVEEQTAATNEISRNVQEAASGTTEVTRNITGVSTAAEEGGKTASDMLTASQALAQESTRLNDVADQFLDRMRQI